MSSHGSKGPSHAPEFVAALKGAGFDFFCGVPCSLLKGLVSLLEKDEAARYVSATREDSALGMAAGAFFGGKRPMVLMQNSGLGVSVNALASLHTMYEIPVLLVISWRGEDRSDAPEHWMMGDIMKPVLDQMKIPHRVLSASEPMAPQIAWAREQLDATQKPVAIIVPAGVLE
ncbi:MAG: thiamine pyrophosphate-binding protein [Minicystis sp.]